MAKILAGLMQYQAGKEQAEAAKATAAMQAKEQVRVSAEQAAAEKREVKRQMSQQKLAYLKSGVDLEGSPLLMMESTRLQGAKNIDEILSSGAHGAASSITEGRIAANAYKRQGRIGLVQGIIGTAETVAKASGGGA